MPDLMEQLHDIEGLDPISFWPLAIGWWVLIAFGIVVIWLLFRRLKYIRSWEHDTIKRLNRLEKNLSASTSEETIACLSECLRRIAVRRFPRNVCAGLVGNTWLKWLKAHDPKQFDWIAKGKIMIEVPYAPLNTNEDLPLPQVRELIQAVRYWVG